ncbi:MAG: cbb3-type cytochrome oxidase assembly protein CcoS [Deltaproteobacteria bacterium]|nr:cbb3-type cytochrome oxidase assembly protein CcoS [Deltaproteobacteria bacterium]MBW2422175.1 cbb3-type cytochrome oxidase assembly protein CcoS [Deltaproteobacteria bacterium]
MSIVFFLIPLGLVLVAIAVWAFLWAVNHDQFEDLDKAAHSILFDDDEAPAKAVDPAPDTQESRDDEA